MKVTVKTNTDRPGLPNYTGPTKGYFTCVHHEVLFEYSHDINERLAYVDSEKPKHEVATRRHNMLYLPFVEAWIADYRAKRAALDDDYEAKRFALDDDYRAKRAPLDDDYEAKRAPLDADYRAKRAALYDDYEAKRAALVADYRAKRAALVAPILAYLLEKIPDHNWNGRTLVFPEN